MSGELFFWEDIKADWIETKEILEGERTEDSKQILVPIH